MTSYLLVALLACGVIEHIHGLDDGISAEFAFDVQKRLLHMQFGVPSWRILGTTIGGTHSLAFGRISGSGNPPALPSRLPMPATMTAPLC